jgi:hypothetical protein
LSLNLFYIGEPISDISPELEEGQQPRFLAPFERFYGCYPTDGKLPPGEQLCCIDVGGSHVWKRRCNSRRATNKNNSMGIIFPCGYWTKKLFLVS